MVVYAIAEEKSLGIYRKVLEFLAFAVALIVIENVLYSLPDRKVIAAELVPDDVAAVFRGLPEVVDIRLLLYAEAVPFGNLVTHNLQVCEFIDEVLEVSLLAFFSRI